MMNVCRLARPIVEMASERAGSSRYSCFAVLFVRANMRNAGLAREMG
jgi:hypothetical protein